MSAMPHDHLRKATSVFLVHKEELDQLASEHRTALESQRAERAAELAKADETTPPSTGA